MWKLTSKAGDLCELQASPVYKVDYRFSETLTHFLKKEGEKERERERERVPKKEGMQNGKVVLNDGSFT